MKIRTDFVTNSSSSSFIIDNHGIYNDKEHNLDDVFNLIKDIYRDYANRVEKIRANYDLDKIIIPVLGEAKWSEVCKEIKDKYSVEKWDLDCYMGCEWFKKCNDYYDYLHYMCKKISEKRPADHETCWKWYIPFRIIDVTQDIDIANTILDWYELDYKLDVSEYSSVDVGGKICARYGRYVIWSESGYMPDFVVKKLIKKCSLYCNHMG